MGTVNAAESGHKKMQQKSSRIMGSECVSPADPLVRLAAFRKC